MNDGELMTAVRESFSGVRSITPAAQIVARGRTVRARRRVPGVAAVATVAAVAVAVGVALPASHPAAGHPVAGHPIAGHPASGPRVVRLAAWTVTRQADGSVQVTFREAADAAALQRTLRADGVPASVTFTGRQNPACQPYPVSASEAKPSPGNPYGGALTGVVWGPLATGFHNPAQSYTTPYAMVIHPAALPPGAGLQIWTSGTAGAADNFLLRVMFVRASPQCTGS